MPPVGRYLDERCQHENPLMEARVRKREALRFQSQLTESKQVHINRAGSIDHPPNTAHLHLDSLTQLQQIVCGPFGSATQDQVVEVRLVADLSNWLADENIRYGADSHGGRQAGDGPSE